MKRSILLFFFQSANSAEKLWQLALYDSGWQSWHKGQKYLILLEQLITSSLICIFRLGYSCTVPSVSQSDLEGCELILHCKRLLWFRWELHPDIRGKDHWKVWNCCLLCDVVHTVWEQLHKSYNLFYFFILVPWPNNKYLEEPLCVMCRSWRLKWLLLVWKTTEPTTVFRDLMN